MHVILLDPVHFREQVSVERLERCCEEVVLGYRVDPRGCESVHYHLAGGLPLLGVKHVVVDEVISLIVDVDVVGSFGGKLGRCDDGNEV